MDYWWWKRCELVREEVSLRREMQRRPEHSFHFSIASLLFSSHRDWACCLLPSVSQPSPDHVALLPHPLPIARAQEPLGRGRRRSCLQLVNEKKHKMLETYDLLLDSIDWFPLSRFFFLNFREPVRNPPITSYLTTRLSSLHW